MSITDFFFTSPPSPRTFLDTIFNPQSIPLKVYGVVSGFIGQQHLAFSRPLDDNGHYIAGLSAYGTD
jgi:hypothetical protein